MIDPHAEEYLELPEINANRIDDNHYDIMQNRIMLAGLCVLVFAVMIGLFVITSHNIEQCQDACYKHLTGKELQNETDKTFRD